MATGFMFANKGKLTLPKIWDTAGAGIIKYGFVKVQAAAHDTVVEIADLNTVADLVAGGSTECDFTNYARGALTRSAAVEDDTNDRVNYDASDIVIASAGGATNNTIVGAFFYDSTTDTNDTTRLLLAVDWFASGFPTNGGQYTYAISDLFRVS